MDAYDKVNILTVDDQPAKLLSYEVILRELGENLISATSGREALAHLLHTDIAVVLMDVHMPEIDGFELAAMIHEHPRSQQTAIIFISGVHLSDRDMLRGYAHEHAYPGRLGHGDPGAAIRAGHRKRHSRRAAAPYFRAVIYDQTGRDGVRPLYCAGDSQSACGRDYGAEC